MDKRYQVFISSTFLDLKEERQAVSQALLRSDCFPAQMENWPAMDAEQMEAIKQIIDESDYYVVISAGKYGSISPETGLSYTEMEYDYAVETGKPIIRLLHKDPFNALRGDQIESKAGAKKKLNDFRTKLKSSSVCSFWENPDQLKNETILGLLDIKRRKPAVGWVRANLVPSRDVELELAKAQAKLSEQSEQKSLALDQSQVAAASIDLAKQSMIALKAVLPPYPMMPESDLKEFLADMLSNLTVSKAISFNQIHQMIEQKRKGNQPRYSAILNDSVDPMNVNATQRLLDFFVVYEIVDELGSNGYITGRNTRSVVRGLRSGTFLLPKTPPQSAP